MNKIKAKNDIQKGFIFLESLLVLSIAVILFSLPMAVTRDSAHKMDVNLFKDSLTNSITSAQNYAVLSGNRIKISLFPKHKEITFKVLAEYSYPYDHSLFLPEGIELLNTRVYSYYFNGESGNMPQFDPIVFSVDGEIQKIVFQIGSGKFEWQ